MGCGISLPGEGSSGADGSAILVGSLQLAKEWRREGINNTQMPRQIPFKCLFSTDIVVLAALGAINLVAALRIDVTWNPGLVS